MLVRAVVLFLIQSTLASNAATGLVPLSPLSAGPAPMSAAAVTAADRVRSAMDFGDFNTATRLLNAELGRTPTDESLLALRADLAARRGQLSGALRQLKTLRDRSPQNLDYRLKQAQYTAWQGRLASAGSAYATLAAAAPGNLTARTGQGDVHFWLGQWREAHAAYSQAITIQDNPATRLGWLRVLAAAGHPSVAAREALAMDKQGGRRDAELGLFIASLYAAVDASEATDAYASRPTGDLDLARRQNTFRAQRALARGQKQQAVDLVRNWAAGRPGDFNSMVDAGDVLAAAGFAEEARLHYERAVAITPERPEAGLGLARLATRAGRTADGLRIYEEVVNTNPEAIEGWLGVARTAPTRGDKSRAWAALDEAQRFAPRSAMVYDAMCKLAFESNNRERMHAAVQGFLTDQPFDTRGEIWLQRWNATHGTPADVDRLNALLDPLAPENTRMAMDVIRTQTKESPQQVAQRVSGGTGIMQASPRTPLEREARLVEERAARAGVSFGHEFSALQNTTGAGKKLPDWHEAFVSAFWGEKKAVTYTMDVRHYQRFGLPAWQFNPGVAWEFCDAWVARLNTGIAAHGDFIPRWRVGVGLDYYAPGYTASFDANYMHFAGARVSQAVPGLAWQWNESWSSTARLYLGRNQVRGQGTDYTLGGGLGVAWEFVPRTSVGLTYAIGGENAAEPLVGLLGEGLFQSIALELKWGLTEHWSVHPLYRFESHDKFDGHTLGLSVHWRY